MLTIVKLKKIAMFFTGVEWSMKLQNLCQEGKLWTRVWTLCGKSIIMKSSDNTHSLEKGLKVQEKWVSVSASNWLKILEVTLIKPNKKRILCYDYSAKREWKKKKV